MKLVAVSFLVGLFAIGVCLGQTPEKNDELNEIIKGTVRLKVELLASGKVGEVVVVSGLTKELNDRAIAAARQIKFEPAKVNGKPVDKLVTFDYGFHIASDENSEIVAQKAQITHFEQAKRPTGPDFKALAGRVIADVTLGEDGVATFNEAETTLPPEFKNSVRKAVKKLKFVPARDKNGNKISVDRKIEYEFTPQN